MPSLRQHIAAFLLSLPSTVLLLTACYPHASLLT